MKIWSKNISLVEEINKAYKQGLISFVEVYAVPGTYDGSIDSLKLLKPKVIIHNPHSGSGFNIADGKLLKHNINVFKEVKKFADALNADNIIVHAGEYGKIKDALLCLKRLNDERIIIENMPKIALNNLDCIGYDKETLEPFLDVAKGICLDFSHACKAACAMKRSYKELIESLMQLNPIMFHLCDGFDNNPKDEHRGIGEGNFNIKYFLSIAGEKALTLETSRTNNQSLKEDINNIIHLINLKK